MSGTIIQQPTIPFSSGFMANIGVVVNNDRTVITAPMGWDGSIEDENAIAASLCNALQEQTFTELRALLSADAYISYVSAEGFYPGQVPFRIDYPSTSFPGTLSADPVPSQVAGLLFFYQDARSHGFGRKRIRMGKTFIPGIPKDQTVKDDLIDAWHTAAITLAVHWQSGFSSSVLNPDVTWYRVLSKLTKNPDGTTPVNPDTDLLPVFECGARDYVCTQRRRLVPR
jgi:hypothetical protein